MLFIKTKIGPSKIHGIGLFSCQSIDKGTLIFRESEFTIIFTKEQYESFPDIQKHFLDVYGYFEDGVWKCSLENERFINHSDNPNTISIGGELFAEKSIGIDEELTVNYNSFCDEWKSGKRFEP